MSDILVRLNVKSGQASAGSSNLGPVLGSKGIPIGEFCQQFNNRTDQSKNPNGKDARFPNGTLLRVLIKVSKDKEQISGYESGKRSAIIKDNKRNKYYRLI